jgi:hypothetical protein
MARIFARKESAERRTRLACREFLRGQTLVRHLKGMFEHGCRHQYAVNADDADNLQHLHDLVVRGAAAQGIAHMRLHARPIEVRGGWVEGA